MAGAEPGDVLGELAEAKAALARTEQDRDERLAVAKKQLQEGKEKAKHMFLKRVNQFEAQIAELEDAARGRESENEQLKTMLRDADERAKAAEKLASEASLKLAHAEDRLRVAVDDAVAKVAKEHDETRARLDEREAQLSKESERAEVAAKECDRAVSERDEVRALLVSRETELVKSQSKIEDAEKQQKELNELLSDERKKVQERVEDLEDKLRRAESSVDETASDVAVPGALQNGHARHDDSGTGSDGDAGGAQTVRDAKISETGESVGDDAAKSVVRELETAQARIADLEGELKLLKTQRDEKDLALSEVREEVARVKSASSSAAEKAQQELRVVEERVVAAEEQLGEKKNNLEENERALQEAKEEVTRVTAEASAEMTDAQTKLKSATESIASLQAEMENRETQLKEQSKELQSALAAAERSDVEVGTGAQDSSASQAMEEAEKRVSELAAANEKLKKELEAVNVSVKDAAKASAMAKESAKLGMVEAEEKIATLTAERDALLAKEQEQKAKVETKSVADSAASTGVNPSSEDKSVLEAKIVELERLLSAKQAEMVKVREKARSYLKDINAEKREMENKLREEMAVLSKEIEAEKEKTATAGVDVERINEELEGCLSVIAEKQKNIQSLNMAVRSERESTRAAKAETIELNAEFGRYKERARLALAEREAALEAASGGVADATAELRGALKASHAEADKLRQMLEVSKDSDDKTAQIVERAKTAEDALELLKKDSATLASTNFARIDALEDELDSQRKQLALSESALANAEAQQATTLVHLEVTERALKAAEVAAEESTRSAAKAHERLEGQIGTLETSLAVATETAAAAQRTAAVAARVMAESPPEKAGLHKSTSFQSERTSLPPSPGHGGLIIPSPSAASDPFSPGARSSSRRNSGLGAFGASPSEREFLQSTSEAAADVASRDEQIAVLMSQIAELGVMLDDAQDESTCREQQVTLLKSEVRDLASQLKAADKLKDGTPFGLLRTTVVHFMRTGDHNLLPVLGTVLGVSEEEMEKVREARGAPAGPRGGPPTNSSYVPSFLRPSR